MDGKSDEGAIRMPRDFRELYGFRLHEFVTLKSVIGSTVTLLIARAHAEDANRDSLTTYVTQNAFDTLKTKDVKEEIQEVELVEGITLGCDPEFFLVDPQGHLVVATRFFRKMAPVGYDGKMVEIRPAPSTNEKIVVDNMMMLIERARVQLNANPAIMNNGINYPPDAIRMVAASSYKGESAGFHLHFGLPEPLLGKYPHNKEMLARQIIKALDFYVGVPSIIPEGNTDYFRRVFPASSYGKPGNFRLSNRTLEYRVPGGNLLRHPILTKGLIGLGAVVVEDIVSRIKEVTNDFSDLKMMIPDDALRLLYPNIPHVDVIYQSIVAPTTTVAEGNMKGITEDVRKMVGYGRRSETLETFFKYILDKRQFTNDIENNWRSYYHERQQRKMDVL
jgi:hypothetical protein